MSRKTFARTFAATAFAALCGCATFQPEPLDNGRGPRQVADLVVPAASLPIPALRAHLFNPRDGLDVTEVAMLAVAHNPRLQVERDKAGVADAQAWKAGLLPDPQLGYEHDHPLGGPPPGTTSAFNASLALNLGDLVTRAARVGAARSARRAVHLELLWSEWQAIAQARTLFDRVYYARRRLARLQGEQAALAPLQASIARALADADLSFQVASAGLAVASTVSSQLATAAQQLHLAEHSLHDLLGLDASVPLDLTGPPFSIDPGSAQVQGALADMVKRRPDLLALQAGYESQQQQLRAAILAQFPAITIGAVRARDNANISSAGFTIGLSLPLFDGNRGEIAVAGATRRQLRDAYAARVLTDRNDVQHLYADLRTERAQEKELASQAAQLTRARRAAEANFAGGRLDWPAYLAIRGQSLSADTALLALEEDRHTTAIALDALTGDWPDAGDAHAREPRHEGSAARTDTGWQAPPAGHAEALP